MENLTAVLKDKTLEDIQPVEKTGSVSNLIEPTEKEIQLIIDALKEGKSHHEIKKSIRREEKGSKLGFSYGQIKEIELAINAKTSELTPDPEVQQ